MSGSDLLEALELDSATYPTFFASLDEFESVCPALPYAHAVRRAWDALRLDGVLYVGRNPAAYFKQVKAATDRDKCRWQRILWNHSVCPLLVVGSRTEVVVYSGQALPAKADEPVDKPGRLVDALNLVSKTLEIRQLVHAIESGRLHQDKPASFGRKYTVNEYLLRNLKAATRLLRAGDNAPELVRVHLLLTRILFACYLIERGIVKGAHYEDNECLRRLSPTNSLQNLLPDLSPTGAKEALCDLFSSIQERFNGSLFDPGVVTETRAFGADDMKVVQRFLRGDSLDDGQLTLGFWAYDFSVMPIETISAIYEDFIEAEGGEARRKGGVYYTPPHLAEMVLDVAIEEDDQPISEKRVLDPACGSGVFLVAAFNRMAEELRRRNPNGRYKTRARELLRLLQGNLWGLDVNETACRITCFSLYLALLDQLEPPDVEYLISQGHRLPELLLRENERQPENEVRPILCRNLFDPELTLPREKFDLIVGNPPWISRGRSRDPLFLTWRAAHRDLPTPQKQVAHGFMWKLRDHLAQGAKCCLLVPSAVFLNKTDKFQLHWFARCTVERLVNLSDLRHSLFAGAVHPGAVVCFSADNPSREQHLLLYEVPKAGVVSQLGGPVQISERDIREVPLSAVLQSADRDEAPLLWKTRFWGTARDLRLLSRLQDMPRLQDIVGKPRNPKRWIEGQGFQPYNPQEGSETGATEEPRQAWWSSKRLFLDCNLALLGLLVIEEDCAPVGHRFDALLRPRDPQLFEPPIVLISQGSSKVAFVDFSVLFRDSLQSIKGPEDDSELLKFLAAVLDSRLAKYYLFHTAANWGTERDKVHFYELLRMPFPLPEDTISPDRSREIAREVAAEMDALKRDLRAGSARLGRMERVEVARRKIDPLVLDYYDVDEYERILVEDTRQVFEPSSTPGASATRVPTLRPVRGEERQAYVETLCSTLNAMANQEGPRVSGAVTYAPKAGQAVVTLRRNGSVEAYTEREDYGQLKDALGRISRLLPLNRRSFVRQRGLKVFQGKAIHMVKPLTLRSWTRTAALNDADEIAAAILLRRRGG